MEGKPLTETIFKKIHKNSVLYAEMADRGAMGEPGTGKLYTLVNGKLSLYTLKLGNSKKNSNDELFDKLFDVLMSLTKDGILIYENAGYGNFAWRKAGAIFKRGDEDNCFTYKDGDKTFKLESSNSGVYQSASYRFADRGLDYLTVKEYLRKNGRKIKSNDELALVNMYIETIRAADAGLKVHEFTVDDYWIAINYLRWKNYEDFNISESDRIAGIEDVARYRLLFIVNQIGWRKVDEIFLNIVKHNITDIIKEFDKYLFEPIENFFSHTGFTDVTLDDPFGDGPNSILSYCKYPLFLNIPPKVQLDIIERITEMSPADLEKNAVSIEYYFANFALGEQRIPYTIILPAALHVVKTMPSSGNPEKHLDFLFWLACEIINKAWKYLEEKEEAQAKFRDTLFKAFWPRFGSIWPIRNFGKFKFNSETEQNIYNEALGWLMSLKDIDTRNPEIRDYLTDVIKDEHLVTGSKFVTRRAIAVALREYSPEEKFKKILNIYKPEAYPEALSYPENIDEAKCLLEELFNPNGRIAKLNRIRMFEQLLINPNSIGVGEYILNYISDNFDKFVEIMAIDSANEKLDSKEVITSIITAIAKGISEENELAPFKAISKKALDIGIDGKTLENAANYARKNRKDILFQRSALQKIF